ncbi:uncharacterized protein LOC130974801 [Arachis stenosperma]|uniref:uncharacterized protein LOC130974801 n=1 Tax=Arachis stenosperma TaxID=217475 RepID=UPI0025AC8EBE|nr:uncharacterized protein LOC130974801 [Arachis stenosperma]
MRRDQRSPKQDPILSSQYVVCEGRYNCRFEALDRTFRNLMSVTDQHKTHQPFGGKIVVLGGDFRQILPVISKGSRYDILASAINSSHLWTFCKVLKLHTNMKLLMSSSDQDEGEMKIFANWILDVGNGNIGSVVGDESEVEILDDLLITTTDDPLSHLVDFAYPNLLQNMSDYRYFQSRAILAPTLKSVEKVNNFVLTIFPRMKKEYLSFDTICQADENEDVKQEWFTQEFLNDIKCLRLSNHKLTLKAGVAVMLLRNIDQTSGLCNGTRLIVNKLGSNVIGATVVTGRNIGDKVYIPRINLIPLDSGLPFKFQWRQFSLTVYFAMTINMSQGQSLSHVRLYLPKSVFTHGQLYVALSRVKSRSGLRVLILNEDGNPKSSTTNVVIFINGRPWRNGWFGRVYTGFLKYFVLRFRLLHDALVRHRRHLRLLLVVSFPPPPDAPSRAARSPVTASRSAKKPPRWPRRLRVPIKLVNNVADLADGRFKIPTKNVTKFIDIPITHSFS